MNKIYTMIFDEEKWGEKEEKLVQYVSDKRKNKILKYKFEIDRKLSLYSELITIIGVVNLTGCKRDMIKFAVMPSGKPYTLNEDIGVLFNISHTRNAIICGFSDVMIGVDTEKIINPPYEIMKSCFSEKEIRVIEQCNKNERQAKFYEIWTRKEAFAKWNGHGLTQEIKKIDVLGEGFKTWINYGYAFSVYSENYINRFEIIEINENEVYEFFDVCFCK